MGVHFASVAHDDRQVRTVPGVEFPGQSEGGEGQDGGSDELLGLGLEGLVEQSGGHWCGQWEWREEEESEEQLQDVEVSGGEGCELGCE